jgi:hypothetical protein
MLGAVPMERRSVAVRLRGFYFTMSAEKIGWGAAEIRERVS